MYISIVIAIVILVIIIAFMARSRRGAVAGPVQLSHLKCSKCNSEFDYAFLPGGSFTSIRLGGSRYLRCPVCQKWSMFNIWNTRVDPKTHHCEKRIGPS